MHQDETFCAADPHYDILKLETWHLFDSLSLNESLHATKCTLRDMPYVSAVCAICECHLRFIK